MKDLFPLGDTSDPEMAWAAKNNCYLYYYLLTAIIITIIIFLSHHLLILLWYLYQDYYTNRHNFLAGASSFNKKKLRPKLMFDWICRHPLKNSTAIYSDYFSFATSYNPLKKSVVRPFRRCLDSLKQQVINLENPVKKKDSCFLAKTPKHV